MLDQETKETYKSIRLHRDLRPDILSRHTRRHASPTRWSKPAAALASLMLCVGIGIGALSLSQADSGVYLADKPLGQRAETLLAERVDYKSNTVLALAFPLDEETDTMQTAECCAPLQLHLGQEVYLAVSGGTLLLPDYAGVPTMAGQSGTACDGATVYWALPASADHALTAHVCDLEGDLLLTLTATYNAEHAVWQISAQKN